jgi:hypothetical protein
MAMESARKLVGGLIGAAASAARHAVWYVRYQVEGVTHDHDDRAREDRADAPSERARPSA